jgi:hypothetical protein
LESKAADVSVQIKNIEDEIKVPDLFWLALVAFFGWNSKLL